MTSRGVSYTVQLYGRNISYYRTGTARPSLCRHHPPLFQSQIPLLYLVPTHTVKSSQVVGLRDRVAIIRTLIFPPLILTRALARSG